jgi:multisubunit Na+/H+ antiporter MnhB subunit
MVQLIACLVILAIAFNSYRVAKRQGQWSWVQDKPGLAALLVAGLIFLFVGALAYFMRKFSPTAKKSAPRMPCTAV